MDQAGEFTSLGYFWAAVLGLVQGLTEFLPVSSSGHLALVEHLGIGMAAPMSFDIMLHLATLLVVVLYFWRTVYSYYRNDKTVLLYIVAATFPAGIVGMLFKKYFEAFRHSPNFVCLGLLVTAAGLLLASIPRRASIQLREMGWLGAVTVGMCQALALTPGISRSGSTIAGAMLCGVKREDAFRFSFILSIPVVLGAVMLHIVQAIRLGGVSGIVAGISPGPLLVGFLVAMATGFVALATLEGIVARGRLVWFAAYCALVAVAGLVYFNLLA